jgi:hypothetical protein
MCLRFVFLLTTRAASWLRLSRRKEAWKTCGCRKPVPPGQMALGIAVGSVKRLSVGRAGLGSAGGGMIFGLWA